jgi:hypothetical protein
MKNSARVIALSAVFTALAVIFLYAGNLMPALRVAAFAAASLFVVAAVIEAGLGSAALVFAGSAVLGLLLLPDKGAAYLYILFFGPYPIVKSLAERTRPAVVQWLIKQLFFNLAFTAVWFLIRELVFNTEALAAFAGFGRAAGTLMIYLVANAAFIVYDIGLTRLIGLYITRISRNIRKNNR